MRQLELVKIDAELKKNKWRNEWLDPTRAWVAPGPLLDIFLFFSKTKIFHSHPWVQLILLVSCFTSQEHVGVFEGLIVRDNMLPIRDNNNNDNNNNDNDNSTCNLYCAI